MHKWYHIERQFLDDMRPQKNKSLRFRVGLASTLSILIFGAAAGGYFIRKEYRYRIAAVESEIKKSAYFLVHQASMLLIQNDAAAYLTFSRVVERIAGKNNFSYVEVVDTKGRVKVPLDTMNEQKAHAEGIEEGPWASLAMGQDYIIKEREYPGQGKVIEGVFGVLEQDRILGYVILGASKKPIEDALRRSMLATAVFLLGAMILSIVLSLKFAQVAAQPVERLKEAVKNFKTSDDLELFNIEGSREVSVLASSMRNALSKIQSHKEEMEHSIAAIKASEGKIKHELKVISDSFRKLSKHLKLEEAVSTILEDIARAIVYCHEAYLILKVSEDGSEAKELTVYPRSRADQKDLVAPDMIEKVLKKGDLEHIPDVKNSVWKGQVSPAFRSCVIYPIYSGGREPLGVLVLAMSTDARFDADEMAALWGVMEPVGMVFDRIFLHAQVERLAVHDSMTGLLNHQNARERLSEALKAAQRQQKSVYIVMADIDKFKAVNDAYGHPAGDKVIKAFANLIQRSLRAGAFAGRYGGEEFLVSLGQTDLEGAQNFAERIQKEVHGMSVEIEKGKSIKFTVSMGLAAFPMDGDGMDELVENADGALYRAKQGGRDRFVIWNEEPKRLKII